MTTADRIKNRRIELGLTQLEVAKRIGLTSKAAVSKIENQGDNVTLKNIEKLASALDCSTSYLMGWTDIYGNELNIEHTASEKRMLAMYRRLDAYRRLIAENMLVALAENEENNPESQETDS